MKKTSLSILLALCSLGMMGCVPSKVQSEAENETVVGYMCIEDNKVYFDEIEIITDKDTDKMKELGLTVENDLPNGYYFYNPSNEITMFELSDQTSYTFTDFDLHFVKDEEGDRIYETTKKEEFLEGSYYCDVPLEEQTVPYFLEVSDGKVRSIREEFLYTQ